MNVRYSRTRGFTLIELLFAIFIFSIVISSVYGAYRATFQTIHGSAKHLNEAYKARVALERITEDLATIVTGPGGLLRGHEDNIAGERGDSTAFISSTHIVLREDDSLQGNTLIQYSSEGDEERHTINLMRADTVIRPGDTEKVSEAVKFLLCSGLKEVHFTYYNKDGEETTEWKAKTEIQQDGTLIGPDLPLMVSIELIFPGQDTSENGNIFKMAVALSSKTEE
ncbi:MAG: hypothetical protein COA36_05630 [Desulfotalea sp.]|nr:MAG: hypothetical protein COA36_05630 [Desulfotalea sp.]